MSQPATVYTYQDLVLALDGHAIECRSGGELLGGLFRHGKVIMRHGKPCLVKLTWNYESNCWEGTVCERPYSECPPQP